MARRTGPVPDIPQNPSVGGAAISEFRGYQALQLMYDIAQEDWSFTELAQATGLSVADIRQFAEDHSREIEECRKSLLNQVARETAGLWITDKANRIAELQTMYEDAAAIHAALNTPQPTWSRSHKDIIKARLEILRHVADELGAMPQRAAQPARTGSTVHYVIETAPGDLEALT